MVPAGRSRDRELLMGRARPTWEVAIISAAMTAVVLVIAVCLAIFTIATLLFGLAQLHAHWP